MDLAAQGAIIDAVHPGTPGWGSWRGPLAAVLCLWLAVGLLAACGAPTATGSPPATATAVEVPTATAAVTSTAAATATSTAAATGDGGTECQIGTGLRQETVPVLLAYEGPPGMVMAASSQLAEEHFDQFEGWIRVLGAPSLEALQQKAQRAQDRGLAYEALAYGLETTATTPEEEWQDMVAATTQARAIADRYGKLLLMGPGFRLMSQHEDAYAGMAALADIWMLQTQRLQLSPPGPEYRQEVERIVSLIQAGNPQISVWAQITLPPDREPDAEEWLAYRAAIADLVDGTYLGIYTWRTEDEALLVTTMDEILAGACAVP
ncbi:MAG: hypothetical protein P8129_05350 [Anaerolineae bacterium]